MTNYIFGVSAPRVVIKLGGSVQATYNFPLTNTGGLREDWTSNDVEGESIDLDTLQMSYEYYEGYWRGKWTLDYSQFMTASNIMMIQEISNYQRYSSSGYEVWLYPRYTDNPFRDFRVKLINDFSIGVTKGGTGAIGNKGITLNFVGLDTFKYGQWTAPVDLIYTMEVNAPVITFQIST